MLSTNIKSFDLFLKLFVPVFAILAGYFHWIQLFWPINAAQEIAFVILFVAAFLWITEMIPLFVTSFVILTLELVWLMPVMQSSGIKIQSQQFLSPFFSNIVLLFMGGLVLSSVMHKYGLGKMLASWMLKKTGSEPARLVLSIMIVSAFLSMWMSNTATAAMMFAIVLPILDQIPKGHVFSKALILAIPFACNLGGMGTPIGTPPNAIAITYLEEHGVTISFIEWMLISIPFLIICLLALWRLLLKAFPAGNLVLSLTIKNNEKLAKKHIKILVVCFVTCLGWLTTEYHGLSAGTISLIPIMVCFGLKWLSIEDFKSLSWDVLFMLGGGLTLGVTLKESGLTTEMIQLIPHNLTPGFVYGLLVLLAGVMTTFMSNTATANLIIPIGMSLDQNGIGLVIAMTLMCSSAMALPVSTPPNAIAFGSGLVKSRDMAILGFIITALAYILIITLGRFYWSWLGF